MWKQGYRIGLWLALAGATVAGANPPDGLRGPYGFLSSAVLGPQPEAEARARVALMAREYGIREFLFYDWFASYSAPTRGDEWPEPFFRRGKISRRTIEVSIEEIHRQGGRAWAYVQAVAAEERGVGDPLRDGRGRWYWHPPGSATPRFPTYMPNARLARLQVARWAPGVKALGFDGIHWDTLGRIAGDAAKEQAGIHAFLETAHGLLARRGLRQTMNFVDLAWWDRRVVRRFCEFPYAEVWSPETERRYYAELAHPEMAGVRGVIAMYASVAVPPGWTAAEVVCARHREARRHGLAYVAVGDGARRMRNEYWPVTEPLSPAEEACLREGLPVVTPGR